jgi:hypothetical protein
MSERRENVESMEGPEVKNYAAIERLEGLLRELRVNPSRTGQAEAIREVGLEIAVAIREVGAMLINVGWEQTFATNRRPDADDPAGEG